MKKEEVEGGYKKEEEEVGEVKDLVGGNKARVRRRNMGMCGEKKVDKMDMMEVGGEKRKPELDLKGGRR